MAKSKTKVKTKVVAPPVSVPVAFYKVKWAAHKKGKVFVVSLADPVQRFRGPSATHIVQAVFGAVMYGIPQAIPWSSNVELSGDPGNNGLWEGKFGHSPFYIQDLSFLRKTSPKKKVKSSSKAKAKAASVPKKDRKVTKTHPYIRLKRRLTATPRAR